MTLWMLAHVFPRDKVPVLLNGRLTEGLEKNHSLGVREPGCLARLLASHFDSRKVIFHISECQFHPSTGSHQGDAEIKKCEEYFYLKPSHEKCPENTLQGLALLSLEWLCGCLRSCLLDTSFLHTQLLDHSPASGWRGLDFLKPVWSSGWQVD